MKKTISIFLLIVLLLNCAGGFLLYKLQEQLNYLEIAEQIIDDKNTTSITISKKEYNQSKVEKHELLLRDKMFDIKSVQFKGDSVIISGVYDLNENHIMSAYISFKKQTQHQHKESSIPVLKFLSLTYLAPNIYTFLNVFSVFSEHFSRYQSALCFIAPLIDSPPPKA